MQSLKVQLQKIITKLLHQLNLSGALIQAFNKKDFLQRNRRAIRQNFTFYVQNLGTEWKNVMEFLDSDGMVL